MNERAATTTTERRVEWPTVGLLVAFAAAYASTIVFHRALPAAGAVVVLAVLGAFYMSLQHELLHGHPTRWTTLNTAIGFVPLPLYLPYVRYKQSHIEHHVNELTIPDHDPESFYVAPTRWEQAGPAQRWFLRVNRTLAGRMTLGTVVTLAVYLVSEARASRRNRRLAATWAIHLAATAALCWLLFGVAGQPVWEYALGFCLGGTALTHMRSFAEHRALVTGTRSAVVEAGPLMSLLYLNNNLHHTHHDSPALAWYELPAHHRRLDAAALAAAGAGYYPGGYVEIVRRYLFRPFCQPMHPLLGVGSRAGSPTGDAEAHA